MPTQDEACIFCKIVAGSIPSARVYEDDAVVAFLDIAPLHPGHTLVVPKDHHATMAEMPDAKMAALGAALPRLARAVQEATGAAGLNVHQANGACAGQVVNHVHVHLIPRREHDQVGFRWRAGTYGEGEMAAWRAKIQRLANRT